MDGVRVGQVWEQVSKHERGMQLEIVRGTAAPQALVLDRVDGRVTLDGVSFAYDGLGRCCTT